MLPKLVFLIFNASILAESKHRGSVYMPALVERFSTIAKITPNQTKARQLCQSTKSTKVLPHSVSTHCLLLFLPSSRLPNCYSFSRRTPIMSYNPWKPVKWAAVGKQNPSDCTEAQSVHRDYLPGNQQSCCKGQTQSALDSTTCIYMQKG